MYEQYTDKQIVEMLVPKLKATKPDWDWEILIEYPERNKDMIKTIATIYRSAYIRGQLGRSFIIGEPKQTEHWVPATKDNVKVGNKVRMIDGEAHRNNPWCFPDVGVVGVVIKLSYDNCEIQWPKGITIEPNRWWCNYERLEVLLCE